MKCYTLLWIATIEMRACDILIMNVACGTAFPPFLPFHSSRSGSFVEFESVVWPKWAAIIFCSPPAGRNYRISKCSPSEVLASGGRSLSSSGSAVCFCCVRTCWISRWLPRFPYAFSSLLTLHLSSLDRCPFAAFLIISRSSHPHSHKQPSQKDF